MSNPLPESVAEMNELQFQRAIENRAWQPKPEPAPVFSPEEIAIRRKIILNLPPEQFDMAVRLKAWRS